MVTLLFLYFYLWNLLSQMSKSVQCKWKIVTKKQVIARNDHIWNYNVADKPQDFPWAKCVEFIGCLQSIEQKICLPFWSKNYGIIQLFKTSEIIVCIVHRYCGFSIGIGNDT